MNKVYLVNPKRTAIGAFLGSVSTVSAVDLAAAVIKQILEQTNLQTHVIDGVIAGHVLTAGCRLGSARQASLKAGVSEVVPAYSINMACGSGMKAVMDAFTSIKAGFGHIYVAGGMESMSQAPYIMAGARQGFRMGDRQIYDHMLYDGLIDPLLNYHMGVTAENIADKYGITRGAQDEFAINSQKKAIEAIDSGAFKDEIVPVTVKNRREEVVFDTDEYPNRGTNLEKLGMLKPAFKDGGTVTAGNASGINDGACFMLVVSEEALKKHNLEPVAELIAIGQGGVEPSIMGMGPVPAVAVSLKMADLNFNDIDVFEMTEAFAAQSLGAVTELAASHNESKEAILARLNLNGGAIALGHPVGASGARIITSLSYFMKKQKAAYGLATCCIGGGMGAAVILKRI